MAEREIKYNITADGAGFESGMARVKEAMFSAQKNIESQTESISSAFKKVNMVVGAFAAALGGGAMLAKFASDAAQFTEETQNLARGLGITTTQAGAYKAAFDDIGISTEEFSGAAQKLAKEITNNEGAINKMGLVTRDAAGNLRPLNDLTVEAIELTNQYKAGTDRAVAGQALFGRGFEITSNMAKLNTDTIEQNLAAQRELGSVVGVESVEAYKAYDDAMDQVDRVMHAFGVTVGNVVMPVITDLANWFNSIAPAGILVFKGALGGLVSAFHLVTTGVTVLWETINAMVVTVAEPIRALGSALSKALTGDFAGAGQELSGIAGTISGAWSNAFDVMAAKAQSTRDRISAIFGNATEGDVPGGGDRSASGIVDDKKKAAKPEREDGRMKQFEAELEAAKVAHQEQNNLREMSKQQELAYWQNVLATHNASEIEKVLISKKMSELRLGILKGNFDREVESLKSQQAAYEHNMAAKLELAQKEALMVEQRYGTESREYAAAQKQIVEIKRKAAEQVQQIELIQADLARNTKLAQIEEERAHAAYRRDLGLATQAETLQLEQEFEQRRYEIARDAMQAKIDLALMDPDADPEKIARLNADKEELTRQHGEKISEITRKISVDSAKDINSIMNTVQRGMENVMGSMQRGWRATAQAVRQAAVQIGTAIIQEAIIKPLAARAAAWVKERAMALAGIATDATKAGSGAASAVSNIPYVGPVLAIAAMVAVMAAVMASQSNVPSAEGGFDIPSGVNPLTQLHEKEMVLPAEHAETIRSLRAGEGGGGETHNHTWNIQAFDGRDVRRVLMENSTHIADAMGAAIRNGKKIS